MARTKQTSQTTHGAPAPGPNPIGAVIGAIWGALNSSKATRGPAQGIGTSPSGPRPFDTRSHDFTGSWGGK